MLTDMMFFIFFFKQKTAYEMRISDWSSDVCSSDLITPKITLPVPEAWGTISALANFYYQSSVAFDPANRINGIAQRGTTVDGYGKLDLRMDWRNIAGSNFSLAAYARNVTNKKYVTGSANQLSSFGTLAYTYSEPRLDRKSTRLNSSQ